MYICIYDAIYLFICHKIPPFDGEKPAFSSGQDMTMTQEHCYKLRLKQLIPVGMPSWDVSKNPP